VKSDTLFLSVGYKVFLLYHSLTLTRLQGYMIGSIDRSDFLLIWLDSSITQLTGSIQSIDFAVYFSQPEKSKDEFQDFPVLSDGQLQKSS